MTKESAVTGLPASEFGAGAYEDIGYDELLTYAVHRLAERGEEATFERIVAECFKLFPLRFQLRGYPQWPDSARVNKSWLRCRTDKGLLVGRVKEGFRLTAKGSRVAALVEARLGGTRKPQKRRSPVDASTKEEGLVAQLEQSTAFTSYMRTGDLTDVSEYDFRDALVCTMDTLPSVLSANLRQFEEAAKALSRRDVLDFLMESRSKFASALRRDEEQYGGGMMRQRQSTKED